MQAKTAAETDG